MSETRVYQQLVAHPCNYPKAVTWCEASATAPDGTVYYARLPCAFPRDPVAVELVSRLARQRAEYLAWRGMNREGKE